MNDNETEIETMDKKNKSATTNITKSTTMHHSNFDICELIDVQSGN